MINYVLCGADCLPVRRWWLAGRQKSLEASAQHSPPIWNCLLYYISGSEQLFHRADAVAKGRVSLSFLKHWAGCLTSRRRYLCILSHALLLWVTFNLLVSRLFSLCFTTAMHWWATMPESFLCIDLATRSCSGCSGCSASGRPVGIWILLTFVQLSTIYKNQLSALMYTLLLCCNAYFDKLTKF